MSEESDILARILVRLDNIDQMVTVVGLEMRATRAELRLDMVELRRAVIDLESSLRDLWTEHLAHSHPEGDSMTKPTGRPLGRPTKTPLGRLEEAAEAKAKAETTFLRWIPEAYRLGVPIARICKATGLGRPAVYNRLRHAGFVIEPLPPRPEPEVGVPDPGWEFGPEENEAEAESVDPAALAALSDVAYRFEPPEPAPEPAVEPVWVDRPVHR